MVCSTDANGSLNVVGAPAKLPSYQNVVLMCHGDRLDNSAPLWAASASRPWDPPLDNNGKLQAFRTGEKFREQLDFPIHRAFVSPFLRCLETAAQVVTALCAVASSSDDPSDLSSNTVALDPSKIKVEKLIKELPSVPEDWSGGNSTEKTLSNGISSQHAENGTNLRQTQSMLLERIASEMNRLKFYITHAQNMPFIDNMEKRIQNASSLLDTSLGHCFVDGLEHRDANAIYNCLRAMLLLIIPTTLKKFFAQQLLHHSCRKLSLIACLELVGHLEMSYRKTMKDLSNT